MLSVVTWKWRPSDGYRSTYPPETVNRLRAMVQKHYPHPHRFLCVTDDAGGIHPDVEIVPDWHDWATVPSPHGGHNPSCYRRLRMFHPDIAEVFGDRFVSLDLDVVITGDLTPLWNRDEDIVMWGDTNPQPGSHYNGSMVLLRAGSRPQVWTEFDPKSSPQLAMQNHSFGSDQGWISYRLGPDEATWSRADGVYSFRIDLQDQRRLPDDCRIVIFHGLQDPWKPYAKQWPWVKEHYWGVAA